MIRPNALATLLRWWELGAAAAVFALGAYWAALLGGYVFAPLGFGLMAAALGLGLTATRRLRFAQEIAASGLIEVIEGELRYFAPNPSEGGFINLPDLVELRLVHINQRRFWRLKSQDGQALMVPTDAAGNAALFDAFSALPQMDSAALIGAISAKPAVGAATQTLWRRSQTQSTLPHRT